MSSLGSPNPFFIAGKKAYEVERSLRFNDNDSAELNKTFSSTGNRKKWTWSAWVKRANLNPSGTQQTMFSGGGATSGNFTSISIYQDSLTYKRKISSSNDALITTTQKLRDTSAWYHFVVYEDAANTVTKFYINGVEVTDFSSSNQPSNVDGFMNTNQEHAIGNAVNTTELFDGYMAEINFLDGYAYDPSYFAETDAITGQWNPKKYVGSYGTNGFYLNFSDNSGTTATTLGKDYSGNGNNFTPNNFAVSDAVKDSPTNNFATLNAVDFNGGSLAEGNLKQDNSGATNTSGTFGMQSGKWYWEIYFNSSSGGVFGVGIGESRRGSALNDLTRHYGYSTNGQFYTTINESSTAAGYGATLSAGDILSVKFNADTREIDFLKNNSSQGYTVTLADGFLYLPGFHANNSDITVNFGQDSTFAGATSSGGNTDGNGQGDFKYSVPSGYKALCSANLPDPTIKLPNKHFDTTLYTGNDSSQEISTLNFQPDWLWFKSRTSTNWHGLFDSVRGRALGLASNKTNSEYTSSASNDLVSFDNDGFTLGSNQNWGSVNGSSNSIVAWAWNGGDTDGKTYTVTVVSDSGNKYRFDGFGTSAVTLDLAEGGTYIFNYPSAHPFRFSTTSDGTHGGGTEYTTGVVVNSSTQVQITVAASAPTLYYYCTIHSGMGGAVNTNSTLGSSNFDGSTQSTVKVNATAGFSIVSYTGNGSTATIGHGLGVAPQTYILKERNSTSDWYVYHKEIAATHQLKLNEDSAKADNDRWQDTDPTSSVFYLAQKTASNGSGDTYIAYCFSEVAGYSKFGSYTGNGSNDGPFVFTGFTPRWILMKCAGSTGNWVLIDTDRPSGGNFINYNTLSPNLSSAENSSGGTTNDILSNGFKLRGATDRNISGQQHIFLAFAESPFKNARAR